LTYRQEITLTTQTDPFFAYNHLSTFGDLGTALKAYVQSYQSRSMAHAPGAINSIADMKRFVEEYPEFQKLGGNVSKHVALVGELSRLVGRDHLMETGEVEQTLAAGGNVDFRVCSPCPRALPINHIVDIPQSVQALINNPSIQPLNKLRLTMLYALRYQKQQANNIATLISSLVEHGVSKEEAKVLIFYSRISSVTHNNVQLVYAVLNMSGADQRQDDLFSIENILAKGRSALKGLKVQPFLYSMGFIH